MVEFWDESQKVTTPIDIVVVAAVVAGVVAVVVVASVVALS